MSKRTVKISPSLTGGFVATLPPSAGFDILWIGPGSTHLHLVSRRPGGLMIPIEPDEYRVHDGLTRTARRAARAFAAAGETASDHMTEAG